jgi:hypothetical protein
LKAEFMSKNNNPTWNTKYGRRRVRNEAPTLDEAIEAAKGLTDEADAQVEIAASLSGQSMDEVRAAMAKFAAPRKDIKRSFAFTGPASAPRTVVVERKPARRIIPATSRVGRATWSASRSPEMANTR